MNPEIQKYIDRAIAKLEKRINALESMAYVRAVDEPKTLNEREVEHLQKSQFHPLGNPNLAIDPVTKFTVLAKDLPKEYHLDESEVEADNEGNEIRTEDNLE